MRNPGFRWALGAALATVALTACTVRGDLAPPARPEAAPLVQGPVSWPFSPQDYRTTTASIYLGNLDARIASLQALPQAQGHRHAATLAAALYHRHRILGRLDDAERALHWADRAVEGSDPSGALGLRAAIRLGLHDFAGAQADLDRLRGDGALPASAEALQQHLHLSLGRYAALSDELERAAELTPDFYRLVLRGNLLVLRGDLAAASRQFRFAQSLYRDVDPMPLAWLHVQQGIALLRFGDVTEARRFFAVAHERLPQYALATEHLAETEALLGNTARARELYERVIAQTGNPEFMAALAEVERNEGHSERADALQQSALAVYEQRLARHPSAFAQHAAEFLVASAQAPRALYLAQQNAGSRQDIGSLILLAETADAAGELDQACGAWRAVDALTALAPPEKRALRQRLAGRCPS